MAFLTGVADLMRDPGGLWEILILKVFKFISNYGWRILFFTVCLKLLLLPLDIFQRYKMRKNQIITERLKPQIEKLQQQYAGDRQTLAQKQMELNRKEGFSYFSSCLPMIVTLVIFFYLFAGLNNISQYKNIKQYAELYDAYTAVETVKRDTELTTVTVDGQEYELSWNGLSDTQREYLDKQSEYKDSEGNWIEGGEAEWESLYREKVTVLQQAMESLYAEKIKPAAQDAAVDCYRGTGAYAEAGGVKESFLWVSNIWSPDVPWRKEILSYSQFKSNIRTYNTYNKVVKKLKVDKTKLDAATFTDMLSEEKYNNVMGKLRSDYNKTNGYLVLPILSVALSFLSQFITSRLQKQSGQAAPEGGMAGSMKFMMFFMPLMMGAFALQYTAMFTLYIVVNSATTILINVFTSLAINTNSKHKEKKQITGVQKYGRPDPKDL